MSQEAIDQPQGQEGKVGPGHDEILLLTTPGTADWEAAETLEADVFIEAGYVEDATELETEYEPYLEMSRFIEVKRHGKPVGSTRMIVPGPNGFKTLVDANAGKLRITDEGWDTISRYDMTNQGFEVGTLSIPENYRSGPFAPDSVSASLYAGIVSYTARYAEEQGRDERGFVLASFDQKFLDNFRGAFGESVKDLGPNQMYMGSLTTPVLIDVEQLLSDDHTGLSELLLAVAQMTKSDVN